MNHLANTRPREKPFFCLLSVEPPHFPYEAPEEDIARWRERLLVLPPTFQRRDDYYTPEQNWDPPEEAETESRLERLRIYYAMIENLDRNVGRLLDWLEAEGLAKDTVVAFLSDHGEMGGMHHHPTAIKETSFEEAIGIPLIIRDPTHPGGIVRDDVVGTEDLFPTFCGLCNLPSPEGLPGIDCSSLLSRDHASLERDGVLIEMTRDERPQGTFWRQSMRGIRTQRWKYTLLKGRNGNGAPEPWQLFDLSEDPYEMTNLLVHPTEDSQRQAARLHEALRTLLLKAGDGGWLA